MRKDYQKWWRDRKIDWKISYQDTFDHPHRTMISDILAKWKWFSLLEVGCGGGANLKHIVMRFPYKQIGGIDINKDAIELCKQTFNGAFLRVGSIEDIPMSDKSTDITLSDMTLLYVKDIHKAIEEIKRVTRHYVILCELHSFKKCGIIKLWLKSGYRAHNYKKLLEKHGFYDVEIVKIPKEVWDGKPQIEFGYIITAKKI